VLLAGLCGVSAAPPEKPTELGKLAASMKPGTWAELKTEGYTPELLKVQKSAPPERGTPAKLATEEGLRPSVIDPDPVPVSRVVPDEYVGREPAPVAVDVPVPEPTSEPVAEAPEELSSMSGLAVGVAPPAVGNPDRLLGPVFANRLLASRWIALAELRGRHDVDTQ